jgi:probable O-glycosylation ligase (exosortase A-associated)
MPSIRTVTDYETLTSGYARHPDGVVDDWPAADENKPFAETEAESAGPAPSALATQERWSTRSGHLLSYCGLFLFTVILYFRPYEYVPALAAYYSMAYWVALVTLVVFVPSQFALDGTITARPREVNLVLLLCVGALLSMPLAINPGEAWATFNETFIKAVLMFIVMINVVRTERRLFGLLLLTMLVSLTLSLDALNDYRLGNFAVEGYRVKGAIGGMFRNPNDLALHLVTVVPIGVGLLFSRRNKVKKALLAVCVLLFVLAIVVTFSRGGFLALMAVSAFLAWKLGRRNRLAVALIVILGGGAMLALSPGAYSGRLASITNFSLDPNGSANARQALLIRSIKTTIGNPLFGIGMGNFHIVSVREQVSHNAYTQVSAEMGIPSMIVYIMFILACLKRLRQMEKETIDSPSASARKFYYLAVGFQAAIIGYMVHSFFASVAYNWYIYYLIGYSICLRRLYINEQKKAAPSSEKISAGMGPASTGLLAGA